MQTELKGERNGFQHSSHGVAPKGLLVQAGDQPRVAVGATTSWRTGVSFIVQVGTNCTYVIALLQGVREIIGVKV